MAACLDPGCFGEITDPYGGLADLDAGTIRVLHPLSFVDDPTRVLRAARFEGRLGFAMDAATLGLAQRAVEMGLLEELSGARVREELLDILNEPAPADVLRRLAGLGGLAAVLPAGAVLDRVPEQLLAAEEAIGVLAELHPGFSAKRSTTLLAVIAASGARPTSADHWLVRLHVGRSSARAPRELAEAGGSLMRQLESTRGIRDSRLYRVLSPLSSETIAVLWAQGDALGRERIERYLTRLASMRMSVSGEDLIALGATPGGSFSAILARAFDDRLDGRAVGRAEELANLRRLAARAGLI